MTDWEAQWRAGDTPWDAGEAAPSLVEYLDEADVSGKRVLVPGCGSGHDVRTWAASAAKVTGLDLSPTAVASAQGFPKAGDEVYVAGDLFAWEAEPFDAVWEHTCFCAIDPSMRAAYAEAVTRLVRPGGKLIGVFYLNPEAREDGSAGPPFGSNVEEIVACLEPDFSLIEAHVPECGFPSRIGREWFAVFRRVSA